MTINLKGEKLVITFQYDPALVGCIKSVSGRQYDPKWKHWTVPKENILELLQSLASGGFRMRLTADVMELVAKTEKEIKVIEEIKRNPQTYKGSLPLYDFQKTGAAFLMTMGGALLADVPGLGKTIQTIAACEDSKRVLILCPASLKYSWSEEILKWVGYHFPHSPFQVIDGTKKEREEQWKTGDSAAPFYIIANYELLLYDYDFIPRDFDVIVCDEATRISNPNAKTTKALKSLPAGKKIALTGTPISNTPVDLYSILDWIAPGVLGTYFQFLNKYCVREPVYNRIVGFKNLSELAKIAERFMLRRTKEEVLTDFPPKTIENISFLLSEDEQELYDNVRYQIIEELKDDLQKNLSIAPVKMLRLKQTTDHAYLIDKDFSFSSKLKVLNELLEPIIASGEKAIVFTQFSEMAKILHSDIKGSLLIYGDVPAEERQKIVEMFNKNPEHKVLIMTEAGAYGLNLQAASYVVHYDMPWSIAKLMQREDRAHRIGQSKPVTVYNLIAKDTIDEYVAKVLLGKAKTAVNILQDQERLEDAGLSKEDIKAILRI